MPSILEIIQNHWRTFYDFESGTPQRVWLRLCLMLAVSLICGFSFGSQGSSFYEGTITVEAILVGFSFNVLFFLAGNSKIELKNSISIERKTKIEKLNKLSQEIFFNVSYFNVISVLSILISIVMLYFADSRINESIFYKIASYKNLYSPQEIFSLANWLLTCILMTVLVFAIIEGLLTFLRIVKRVNYYFKSRISLEL